MKDKNDRPAFPYTEYNQDGSLYNTERGMTLRDWFAGQALNGWLSTFGEDDIPTGTKALAIFAYEIADAMLEEREKGHE